tara:strand:+ start:2463 stop:3113 length:651 start_codon:yes stop_codon:yes gene_type:complete
VSFDVTSRTAQHADTYKKPLVVNTVDLTEEATIRFKSKLQNLVDLDEMPKEHKYQKHSSPDTPAPPFVPAPAASGTQEGGIVLFGSAHPLPPQTTTTPAANEGAAPAPQPEEPSNSGNGGSAAATAGSAGATGHPPSETAGATVPPSKPKVPRALPLSLCCSTHPLFRFVGVCAETQEAGEQGEPGRQPRPNRGQARRDHQRQQSQACFAWPGGQG